MSIHEDSSVVANKVFDHLSTSPSNPVKELPITTSNKALPFDKLAWEDFERFCFQLGCKKMKCLETSYIYGRKGQKQDGIDILFQEEGVVKVWQIKRYATFDEKNVRDAVSVFKKGKWFGQVKEFTLCVSNYLDDVHVVDEIVKQANILNADGINFSVLNSEKLTVMVMEYPELIRTFFGDVWLQALGLAIQCKQETQNNSYWQTQDGRKIDPNKVYKHGNTKFKMEHENIFVEQTLPDGANIHASINPKNGAVSVQKPPVPWSEFTINIPPQIIVKREEGIITISGTRYLCVDYHLKWGKHARFYYEQGQLVDLAIDTRTFIDYTNKVINVFDIGEDAEEL